MQVLRIILFNPILEEAFWKLIGFGLGLHPLLYSKSFVSSRVVVSKAML